MSFLNDTKTVGWMIFVLGIIQIVYAIVQIINGATAEGDSITDKIGWIIVGIGSLIAAIVYFKFGNGVRKGEKSGKLDLVASFVKIVGYTTIIKGIFAVIGYVVVVDGAGIGGGIIAIILGIVISWCGGKIDDGKNTGFDKILWIILVVVFVIMMISYLITILSFAILPVIAGICGAIVYLVLLIFMFDKEIKDAML